ncbi:DUF397 domain-containing protein [Streptomyces sp. NPDC102406]|uniref:DUF397 domain-containing protein n=1 Tax=Streptomyces sp. NPDC102406 TaxID=3366171 RepID=UPI003826C601
MSAPYAPHWFKSSYSGGSGTECVETARTVDGMLVRDSKRSDGPRVRLSAAAWSSFVAASPSWCKYVGV